jgi:nucleoside-diphosphate-sugar epimerase
MKSRCVSLTGATGFLGRHIAEAFDSRGWTVRAVVRPGSPKALPLGVERREADLLNVAALGAACDGSAVVVHAAGLVRARHPDDFEAVNVHGVRAVVEAANSAGARLVHLSSLAAVGPGTTDRPAREDDPPKPVNAYGRSKLAGERVVRDLARVPWIVLRPSAVYGPGDRGFLPLVRLASRGLFPLAAPGTMPFTLIYIDDVARAVVNAAEGAVSGGAFFIGHAEPQTTEALLRAIAGQLGRRYRPLRLPTPVVRAMGSLGDAVWALGGRPPLDSARVSEFTAAGFVCDVSRARERLGFSAAVDLPDGLARTVRWYRERGWI